MPGSTHQRIVLETRITTVSDRVNKQKTESKVPELSSRGPPAFEKKSGYLIIRHSLKRS